MIKYTRHSTLRSGMMTPPMPYLCCNAYLFVFHAMQLIKGSATDPPLSQFQWLLVYPRSPRSPGMPQCEKNNDCNVSNVFAILKFDILCRKWSSHRFARRWALGFTSFTAFCIRPSCDASGSGHLQTITARRTGLSILVTLYCMVEDTDTKY